jgi:hypothetical protein
MSNFEPWLLLDLTEDEYKKPLAELPEDKRLAVFMKFNAAYNIDLKPEHFNIKGKKDGKKQN